MRCSKSSSKREVYSNARASKDAEQPQEMRKISNEQPNLTPKELEKEQTKPKVSRRKEIKDQSRNK